MINEKKKTGKIIDELATFFLKKGHWDLQIDIKFAKEKTIIIVELPKITENEHNLITKCLSQQRDETMEEYGWELMGESETSSELNLVGMCIDTFTISAEPSGKTRIELIRYHG